MSKRDFHRHLTRFFDATTRRFKTDTRYLTTGSIWLLISRGLFVSLSLLLTIAFANLLPPDDYGMYRFILSLSVVASVFSLTGIRTTLVRDAARNVKNALDRAFRDYFRWSIGAPIAAICIAGYYFINDNNTIAFGILIVGLLNPLREGFRLYSSFLLGRKEFKKNALYGQIRGVIPITLMIGALYLTDDVVTLLSVYFISTTIAVAWVFFKVRREFAEENSPDPSESLNYSKHLSLMNIADTLAGQADKILVFHFLGTEALAIYAFATMPPSHLRKASDFLKILSFPKLAERSIADIKKSMPNKVLLTTLVVVPTMLAYIALAPLMYKLIFPQYVESILLSQVFALSLLFVPLIFYGQTLKAHGKKTALYTMQIIQIISKLVALALLLPIYGVWGALASFFISKSLSSLIAIYYFYKKM